MKLQCVNNQPSFKAKLSITQNGVELRYIKIAERAITPRQEYTLGRIANKIGTEFDEIAMDIGPVFTDSLIDLSKIRHRMVYGAIKRVGEPLALLRNGSLVRSHKSLREPFLLIKELLRQIENPAYKSSTLTPTAMAKVRMLKGK